MDLVQITIILTKASTQTVNSTKRQRLNKQLKGETENFEHRSLAGPYQGRRILQSVFREIGKNIGMHKPNKAGIPGVPADWEIKCDERGVLDAKEAEPNYQYNNRFFRRSFYWSWNICILGL